jgi:hypothetical protein
MQTRTGRRAMNIALVLCALGNITACAARSRPSNDFGDAYPLLVNNRSDFEVVVYAMASPSTRGMRLGTARPFATTYLKIPAYALQSQDLFAVQLHAIGAVRTVPNWTSATTVLNENLMAQLDIIGDRSGNLRLSNLSAKLARSIR